MELRAYFTCHFQSTLDLKSSDLKLWPMVYWKYFVITMSRSAWYFEGLTV